MWSNIGLGFLALIFLFFCFPGKFFDFFYFFVDLKDKFKKKENYTPTRNWECKHIINTMWDEKEKYFTKEFIEEFNTKSSELEQIIVDLDKAEKDGVKEADNWKEENIGKPAAFFDPLGLYQLNQDNSVKYQHMVEKASLNIEVTIAKLQTKFARLSLLYNLLKYTNDLVKSNEFIEIATKAFENDIRFLEKVDKKTLTEGDKWYGFIETLLKLGNFENYQRYNVVK